MTLDELYERVTGAIVRAERIDEADAVARRRAFLSVSELEEEIAKRLPAGDPEGAVARRGAVRAAVNADEFLRAETLYWSYLDEGVPDELKRELTELMEDGRNKAELATRHAKLAPRARFTIRIAA